MRPNDWDYRHWFDCSICGQNFIFNEHLPPPGHTPISRWGEIIDFFCSVGKKLYHQYYEVEIVPHEMG